MYRLIKMKLLAVLCVLGVASASVLPHHEPFSDEMIDYINNLGTTWKAGHNFKFIKNKEDRLSYVKRLCGVLEDKYGVFQLPEKDITPLKDLPTNFDSRTQWANCPSLKEVRDQGDCGSCWAFGAVEALTDHATVDFQEPLGHGSEWRGCQPYLIEACDHHVVGKLQPCPKKIAKTPRCSKKCEDGYTSSAYSVRSEEKIMTEIMTNGPVEAAFTVYADFPQYKSGVYEHKTGQALGGHAVKIIGWGEDNGVKFWTVANSWNADWGNQDNKIVP
ncbi:hypothetical protein KUTeg_000278 [Tegillarca granosa]|uniref:Peptidase C1A papain C-terminal domain-containing protein n=1 Tax=Tegillarca granosa TaxID=220873 RepID=A0ABQ9G0I8_TEGGR|nr:hypothetical protein KUTeg_000278 [Tegillarca granosa]